MADRNITTDEQNIADWDACDEHRRSFPRGDACPGCLYDETISLRAECVTKALEIERLRALLREIVKEHDDWHPEPLPRELIEKARSAADVGDKP